MAINAKPVILYGNVLSLGTPTATDTETGYSVLNLLDRRTYTFWQADSHGTKYLTIDCTTAQPCDALGIMAHNLYTCSATVSVESSTNNTDWTERLPGFTCADNTAVLKQFTSASARYWRVKIVTAAIAPQMAVVYLGAALTMEYYPQSGFDPYNEKPVTTASISESGNLLGINNAYIAKTITASFKQLTPSWVTNTFKPAWDAHFKYGYPFFWAWDLTNHASEVDFARLKTGNALALPLDPIRHSLTLAMEGVVE